MILDRYLFRTLLTATLFVSAVLVAVIFLTQSLQFLEMVINAGASGGAFWTLTVLALPRTFEIILPIAMMAATVFVYNRLTMDSELVVLRASGITPFRLARPAIILSVLVAVFLFVMIGWIAPASFSKMQHLRQAIKAQVSTLLFREGVFNPAGKGVTVFIRERDKNGELHGLMIHDSREKGEPPATIIAKRGVIVSSDEGQEVVVYDGSRQAFNPQSGTLDRLDFQRYTLDLPESERMNAVRWKEPDERSLPELFHPDLTNAADVKRQRTFAVEAVRRIISPLLAPAYTLIALSLLTLGSINRRGQGWRIVSAVVGIVLLQGAYLASLSLARDSDFGLLFMAALVLTPIVGGVALLFPQHDVSMMSSSQEVVTP
jgi:lipopolysaccharide export system permease protein